LLNREQKIYCLAARKNTVRLSTSKAIYVGKARLLRHGCSLMPFAVKAGMKAVLLVLKDGEFIKTDNLMSLILALKIVRVLSAKLYIYLMNRHRKIDFPNWSG
jgi:hypothetical protein